MCRETLERLRHEGLMDRIDRLLTVNVDDPEDEGLHLALRHGICRVPFFVIRDADGNERAYDSYSGFKLALTGRWGAACSEVPATLDCRCGLDYP